MTKLEKKGCYPIQALSTRPKEIFSELDVCSMILKIYENNFHSELYFESASEVNIPHHLDYNNEENKKFWTSVIKKINILHGNLVEEQDSELRRELKTYGVVSNNNDSGYLQLSTLSKKNLLQIKSKYAIKNLLSLQVEQKIKDLQFQPCHFSKHSLDKLKGYIFSSKQIESLGILPFGRNSFNAFNRVLLESDNNVFFFPYSFELLDNNQYGICQSFLELSYAAQMSWVAPSLMFEEDLKRWANLNLNYKLEDIKVSSALVKRVKLDQKKYIFNFRDFVEAVKHLCIFSMEILYEENIQAYSKYLEMLEEGKKIREFIKLSWKYMGLHDDSSEFELRIPIAVPSKYMYY